MKEKGGGLGDLWAKSVRHTHTVKDVVVNNTRNADIGLDKALRGP